MRSRHLHVLFVVCAVASLPFVAGCHESASAAEPVKESGVTWLTPDQIRTAQIETAPAAEHAVDEVVATTGRVTFDDQRVAHVFSPVTGRVASVDAALGQRLKRGAPLATIVSPEVGQWSSDLHKADADLIAAGHDFKRKSELFAVNAVAQADYESSEDNYRQAKAEKDRAQQKAQLLRGSGASSISQGYTLTTPIDGEVIARQLNPGIEVQGQYDTGNAVELFTIGELDKVWVLADVYESDLGRVAVGREGAGQGPRVPRQDVRRSGRLGVGRARPGDPDRARPVRFRQPGAPAQARDVCERSDRRLPGADRAFGPAHRGRSPR